MGVMCYCCCLVVAFSCVLGVTLSVLSSVLWDILYKCSTETTTINSCVEADLNTSTIALQDIGGDKNGTQCLGA
jgi:hypothetical protein